MQRKIKMGGCGKLAWTVGALVAGAVQAADLTITSDVTNWQGLTLPAAGEELVIGAGVTAKVTTLAALEAIGNCARIRPLATNSVFEVEVPSGETWTNSCAMSAVNLSAPGNRDFQNGELRKTGAGTLCLRSTGHLAAGTKAGSLTLYDWWTGLTVAEGHLRLPKSDADGTYYVGYVTVSNNAVFNPVEDRTTYVRGLAGEGRIVNEGTANRVLCVMNEASVNRDSVFSGTIEGAAGFYKHKDGKMTFLGTNSTFAGVSSLLGGTTEVMSLDHSKGASSLGVGTTIVIEDDDESRLRYLGTGERTTKELFVGQHATRKFYLDGGPTGGLEWAGTIRPNTDLDSMRTFVFTGDGTARECVVSGRVLGNYASDTSVYGGLFYEKWGRGTWRFADNADRSYLATGFAIREGTLAYDSLDERTRSCALGVATNLTASGGAEPLPRVDYAFTLGTTAASDAPAVFAYTGTNGYACSTRPLALTGTGGSLRNDTARRIRFRGVSSLADDGVKTLTLDGSGANTNEVADIADGAGQTAVCKDGSGIWCLSGDLTFTGPLTVKKGTMIVRKTLPGLYKWFRWTIQEKNRVYGLATGNTSEDINIAQIGLYNKKGAAQSTGLKLNDSYSELKPGEFGFETVRTRTDKPYTAGADVQNPESMFSGSQGYGMWANFKDPETSTGIIPYLDKPHLWLSVVMRLKDTADEIAYFDFMNVWRDNQGGRCVKISSLEGSVDGLHWNMLTNRLEVPLYSVSWTWGVSGRQGTDYTSNHTNGAPVVTSTAQTYSVLTGNPTVTVAPGATLVADGEMTISKLAVDGVSGLGTIDGFTFADTGSIDILGARESIATWVPATFLNSDSVSQISGWSVSVNGKADKRYRVAAAANGIRILKPGLRIVVR